MLFSILEEESFTCVWLDWEDLPWESKTKIFKLGVQVCELKHKALPLWYENSNLRNSPRTSYIPRWKHETNGTLPQERAHRTSIELIPTEIELSFYGLRSKRGKLSNVTKVVFVPSKLEKKFKLLRELLSIF